MEKHDGLGRWVSVLANLGVIAGLLLLVYELGQNHELMRAQTRHELSTVISEHQLTVAANPQLASIIRRGDAGEALSPDEQIQFEVRSNSLFRYWEDVHYQFRRGLYDPDEFNAQRRAWAAYLENSFGGRAYWCGVRALYVQEFRDSLDELMPEPCGGE